MYCYNIGISCSYPLFNKNQSTSYKEHFKLYTKIHDSIAVNSCQIELARKDIILLSNIALILYRAVSGTDMEDRHIKFALSAGPHSIDDFNAKVTVVVSKKGIPEHYIFMASDTFCIALGILDNYLEKTTRLQITRQSYFLAHKKHPLIHHLPQNHCHCTINK